MSLTMSDMEQLIQALIPIVRSELEGCATQDELVYLYTNVDVWLTALQIIHSQHIHMMEGLSAKFDRLNSQPKRKQTPEILQQKNRLFRSLKGFRSYLKVISARKYSVSHYVSVRQRSQASSDAE